jgi:pantetheine-phosphate adenylyltransferase
MTIGLFPGTFDPPTLGHIDLIERASLFCKKIFIGVAKNSTKKFHFSQTERVELLLQIFQNNPHIEIVAIDGLTMDFAYKNSVHFLIRGLRPFSNLEHEFQMALANKKLGGVETIFLMANGKYAHISSTLIREIAQNGHNLKEFIPEAIEPKILERFSS